MNRAQVAVVGAGPAGLGAAIAAARSGAEVVLLDEGTAPGGRLRDRLPSSEADAVAGLPLLPPLSALLADARDAGVDLRPRSVVWAVFEGNVLGVAAAAAAFELAADVLVVATGSTDLARPFPGASLPGVFSGRALQILLNRHRVLPGRRVAILGDGLEAAEVARDARLAGAEIVVAHPAADGVSIAAEGRLGVETLTIDGERFAVDVVAVAVGRQPDAALPLMAGRAMAFASELGGWIPALDDLLRTDDPRLLCAGDAAGPCHPAVALAEGRFAGASAAATLALLDGRALADARATYENAAPARVAARRSLNPTYAQPDEWEPS